MVDVSHSDLVLVISIFLLELLEVLVCGLQLLYLILNVSLLLLLLKYHLLLLEQLDLEFLLLSFFDLDLLLLVSCFCDVLAVAEGENLVIMRGLGELIMDQLLHQVVLVP